MSSGRVKVDLGKYEYPKKSGIKISLVQNSTSGKNYGASYRVYIPSKYTGKAYLQKQLPSEAEAKEFASSTYKNSIKHGTSASDITTAEILDAQEAINLLKGSGINSSLKELALYAIPRLSKTKLSTLGPIIQHILELKKRKGCRSRTLSTYRSRWNLLLDHFGDITAQDISVERMEIFLNGVSQDGRTVQNYFTDINNLFKVAKNEGLIIDNPLDSLTDSRKDALFQTALKSEKDPPEIYLVEEAEKLLIACLNAEHPILFDWLPCVALGLFCGLRTNEIRNLTWNEVHLDRDKPFVHISSKIAKKRRIRNIEISQNAAKWFRLARKSEGKVFPFNGSSPYDRRRKLVHKIAGVALKNNGMRDSYGSYHLDLYKKPNETSLNMGHKQGDQELFDHYRRAVLDGEGRRYFNIHPPEGTAKIVKFAI